MTRRNLTDVSVDGIDTRDAPDFTDAYICYATWADTGEALTDAELDTVNEDNSLVYDYVIAQLY